jgi:hypothetical protein
VLASAQDLRRIDRAVKGQGSALATDGKHVLGDTHCSLLSQIKFSTFTP